jgi:hypothetical protein
VSEAKNTSTVRPPFRFLVFPTGHCLHKDRGDGTAVCNVGGHLGMGSHHLDLAHYDEMWDERDLCRICFPPMTAEQIEEYRRD